MEGNIIIPIDPKDPFRFDQCLYFLDRGYDECLYQIRGQQLSRWIKPGKDACLIQITAVQAGLQVKVLHGNPAKNEVVRFVDEWFDLSTDLHPFYERLDTHSELAWMAERYYGLRLLRIPDLFEALAWCIIGQQINLSFAYRLKRRLVEAFGDVITFEKERYFRFPTPEQLVDVDHRLLREMQFSRQKAEYLKALSVSFLNGAISKQMLLDLPTKDQQLACLLRLRGVGPWTANYVMMKTLGDRGSIPYGDAGLHQALRKYLSFQKSPTRDQLDDFFKPFRGWESYLVFYLWRSLA